MLHLQSLHRRHHSIFLFKSLQFFSVWDRVFKLCSGLWRLWRRQLKSVTLCYKNRKTASPSPCTVNTVLKMLLYFILGVRMMFINTTLLSMHFFMLRIVSKNFTFCRYVLNASGIFIAGLLKTHNLSYQDSESLQAMFDKDSYANVFRSQARSAKYSYIPFVNTRCTSWIRLISRPMSSPHVCFLCFVFCSGSWWTQSRTSLSP